MIFSNGSIYYGSRASGSQLEHSHSSEETATGKARGLRQLQNGLNKLTDFKQNKSLLSQHHQQSNQTLSKSTYPGYGFFFPKNENVPSVVSKEASHAILKQGTSITKISQIETINEKDTKIIAQQQRFEPSFITAQKQPKKDNEISKQGKKIDKNASLVEENISLGREVHQLQDKYAKALGEINRLLQEKNEVDKKIEARLLQRVKQIDELRINYARQKQNSLKLQIKMTQLQMELKQKERQIEELKQQDNDYSSTYAMVQQKCKQMIKQNERICKIYEEFELTSNEERQSLTCRTSELQRKIGKKQAEIRQLKQRCLEQQMQIKYLEQKRQQLENKVKELDQKCLILQGKIEEIEQRNKMNEEKTVVSMRTISGSLNCKQQQIKYLTQKHKQELYKLSLHMNELRLGEENKIRMLEQKLQESGKELEKVKQQQQKVHGQIKAKIHELKKQYESKLHQVEKRRNEQKSKLDIQNYNLKLEITEMTKKCHEKEKLLVDLHQTLSNKSAEYNRAISQIGQQFENNRKLKQEIKRLTIQQQQLINKQNSLRFLLEEENRRKRTVQVQLCEVTNNFHEFYKKVDEKVVLSDHENRMKYQILKKQYEKECSSLKENISIKQENLEKTIRQNDELRSQVKSVRIQLQNYQGMYDILSKKLKETTNVVNLQQSQITKKEKSIKMLQRELESFKIEVKIMKEEKQRNQAYLNSELDKRKEMIQSLIKQKKMLYSAYDQNPATI